MQVRPSLYFEGRCEEALGFYRRALGAEVTTLLRFKDSPVPYPTGALPPGSEEKILHASFQVGESIILASDASCSGHLKFEGIRLSLTVETKAEAKRIFQALIDGGQVLMPLSPTFFSPSFGMVTDRFGVSWSVHATAE